MAVNPMVLLGGVGVVALGVVGGLYATGTGTAEPSLVSLKEEADYKGTSNNTKFGYKFSSYFLSTTNSNNNKKWEERVAALNKSDLTLAASSYFESLKGSAKVDTLKTTCKSKYDETGSITDEAKWKEVWIYCSLGGTAPVTLEHSTDDNEKALFTTSGTHASKVGGTKKTVALSTKSKENDWIWKIKNEEKNITSTDTYFNGKKEQDLKAVCEEAYKQDANGSATPNIETQVETYCSKPRTTVNA